MNTKSDIRKASGYLRGGCRIFGLCSVLDLATCEKVGFTPGFFSIDAGAGKHTYILQESGNVRSVDKEIKNLNIKNWIGAGYKERVHFPFMTMNMQ